MLPFGTLRPRTSHLTPFPQPVPPSVKRNRCPTSFLEAEEITAKIQSKLEDLCLYWALSGVEGKSSQSAADEIRSALTEGDMAQPPEASWARRVIQEANVATWEEYLRKVFLAGYSGWGEAMKVIRRGASKYELSNRETGFSELQVLAHKSSLNWLPAAAWDIFKSRGHSPKLASAAYSLLVSYALSEDSDRTGTIVSDKLKILLADTFESDMR